MKTFFAFVVGLGLGLTLVLLKGFFSGSNHLPTDVDLSRFIENRRCESGSEPVAADRSFVSSIFVAGGHARDQISLGEEGRNNCAFNFSVGEDSYLSGKGFIIKDANQRIVRVELVSRMDRMFVANNRPTFSLMLFEDGARLLVLNTFDNSLYSYDAVQKLASQLNGREGTPALR